MALCIDSLRPRALIGVALLILAGLHLAACSRETGAPWPEEVVPSELLAPHVSESLDLLTEPDAGDPDFVADLLLYDSIWQGLYDRRSRKSASMQLHETWSSNPAHPLWPVLAIEEWWYLDDYRIVFETYKAPVCTDTTTAVGIYASTWRAKKPESLVANFDRALARSAGLDPFFRFWIALSSASASRRTGQYDQCAEKSLTLLADARTLGGPRLESIVWYEIMQAKLELGDLDDALIAATLADTLVTLAGGPVVGVLDARLGRANVLAARWDSQAALALYESNAQTAAKWNLAPLAGDNLNRAGTVADAMGQPELALEYDIQCLRIVMDDDDSLHVPRQMANIATGYRLMGELDSCRTYMARAEKWVSAYPIPQNVGRFLLFQAEYHLQTGAYDVAESLLTAAGKASAQYDSPEQIAEFYIEMIQGWLQAGRPDLVYRLIEQSSHLRAGVADTYADRNVSADLNLLIGEFYARRGQFALADESLDLAAAALESRTNLTKEWSLARNRGLLDRARGSLRSAEEWFQECVRIGEELGYPDLSATGRLLVGSVRLESGDFAGARETFPSDELESSLDTRILVLLLTGVSHLREGHPEIALGYLNDAHAECRAWTPLDLTGRIELELGRAHHLMGDQDTALESYERVASRIHDVDFLFGSTDELAYFTGDLRRDLVEARLAIEDADARASLEFAMSILPRWTGVEGGLRSPQAIYFVGEKLSGRWIVGNAGVSWEPLPGSSELANHLAPVRADMGTPGRAINENDVAALSESLLGGIGASWPNSETLHIVPDLIEVPWSALQMPDSGQTVIEHGSIAILDRPIAGDALARSAGDRLLVIATDSSGSSGLDRLRHAEKEAMEVGATWPAGKADLRTGRAATNSLLPGADLSPYRAIHVASHALVYTGRADQTTLLLDSADEGAASASSVRDLEIEADLVFLSACEAGDGGETRSVHAGLARSFQDAGARQVIAPISVIDDEAAREFAVRFYENWQPGTSVADALRATQLQQRSGERSHPFYWAFYQVFGDSN